MERLSAMENYEYGKVCWIASRAAEYFSKMGVEYGTVIQKVSNWGDAVVFACNGRRFVITEIADGLGVIPEKI